MNNLSATRLLNDPREEGRVPVSEFHCIESDCNESIPPIPEGIVPVKLLYAKCISFKVVTSERDDGIEPVRRFA